MKKKRVLLMASAVAAVLPAAAAEPHLMFETTDGTRDAHKLSEVVNVRFAADGLKVSSITRPEESSYDYATLSRVVFDHEGVYSGVDKVEADNAQQIRVYPNPAVESFSIAGLDGAARLGVYSTDGRCVIAIPDYAGEAVDVTPLSSGVYIVKVGTASAKFFKAVR